MNPGKSHTSLAEQAWKLQVHMDAVAARRAAAQGNTTQVWGGQQSWNPPSQPNFYAPETDVTRRKRAPSSEIYDKPTQFSRVDTHSVPVEVFHQNWTTNTQNGNSLRNPPTAAAVAGRNLHSTAMQDSPPTSPALLQRKGL